jgi:hypothetical protein
VLCNPDGLRTWAAEGAALAACELKQPSLYSLLVDLAGDSWNRAPRKIRFGFQELRQSTLFGTTLTACWVQVSLRPRSSRIISSGTYGARQFAELNAVQGFEFPPPTLDLSCLRLGTEDVVVTLQRTTPLGPVMGSLGLSLCLHDGRLSWRALQEAPESGCRTVVVDAGDGQLLFEKIDWWRSAAPPTRS